MCERVRQSRVLGAGTGHAVNRLNPTGQPRTASVRSVAPDCSPEQYLASENNALRKAGCKLAEAALYVAREYDGVHRLMLAVAEWAKAVADEGGRGRANAPLERSARSDDTLRGVVVP